MEPQTAPENGYKQVKMLPSITLGAEEWPMPADIAVKVLAKLWQMDAGDTFLRVLQAAMNGTPVTIPGGRGKRMKATPQPAQHS